MGFLSIQSIIPPGTVLSFAGSYSPSGWELCDGRAVSRTTYAALFAAIGTAYGTGNGTTTFNLPDYRWTFLRGRGPNLSVTGSGTAASNQATFSNHGFNRTGVRVRVLPGTLTGLSLSTDYWVIVVDENTLAFAASREQAISNTRLNISGTNNAVITQYEDPDISTRKEHSPGGNTSAGVGSYQTDEFRSHDHQQRGYAQFAAGYSGAVSTDNTTGQLNTALSGGRETRPTNISVNYIIKV